jgi:hypothetical protein
MPATTERASGLAEQIPASGMDLVLRSRVLHPSMTLPETRLSLREKLDRLFDAGLEADDAYAVAIPLLMQGKVRLDIGERSERIELDDPGQRQTRPNAVRIFESYLALREASPVQG